MTPSAIISPCSTYRYLLRRVWGSTPPLPICMLNPSTADALLDDPTIRRCVGFARRDGYGGIAVVNLFSLRSTDPSALDSHSAPIGPDTAEWQRTALYGARQVLCAWGSHPMAATRASSFLALAQSLQVQPMCLGRTKAGAPRHPLYVRADQPMEIYP